MSVSLKWGYPIRQVLFVPVWSLWLNLKPASPPSLSKPPLPSTPPSTHQMAIAPITGKLRKRFWVDVTTALGLGVGAGYAYWFVFSGIRLPPS